MSNDSKLKEPKELLRESLSSMKSDSTKILVLKKILENKGDLQSVKSNVFKLKDQQLKLVAESIVSIESSYRELELFFYNLGELANHPDFQVQLTHVSDSDIGSPEFQKSLVKVLANKYYKPKSNLDEAVSSVVIPGLFRSCSKEDKENKNFVLNNDAIEGLLKGAEEVNAMISTDFPTPENLSDVFTYSKNYDPGQRTQSHWKNLIVNFPFLNPIENFDVNMIARNGEQLPISLSTISTAKQLDADQKFFGLPLYGHDENLHNDEGRDYLHGVTVPLALTLNTKDLVNEYVSAKNFAGATTQNIAGHDYVFYFGLLTAYRDPDKLEGHTAEYDRFITTRKIIQWTNRMIYNLLLKQGNVLKTSMQNKVETEIRGFFRMLQRKEVIKSAELSELKINEASNELDIKYRLEFFKLYKGVKIIGDAFAEQEEKMSPDTAEA